MITEELKHDRLKFLNFDMRKLMQAWGKVKTHPNRLYAYEYIKPYLFKAYDNDEYWSSKRTVLDLFGWLDCNRQISQESLDSIELVQFWESLMSLYSHLYENDLFKEDDKGVLI
ncbi:hypothetical protein IC620_16195 [Hazenella sp. IB182357]|uniref:Uncharacterized protein n=1 Tax=Polycladospora coralii TaxID=2771432 RepID=A0A926N8B1_9BACL|nr:hypothetical protein [Polycladospora coralii]MBD1373886.1 hypothetical protein [Polycladospora coralii]